jgi:NifU-like protein involved in Fe-S cluster formation
MGALSDLGVEVRACALGQASASLMAAHALGRTAPELAQATMNLRAFLAGEQDAADFWPGIGVFAAARDYPARHPSIMLAFDAVSLAMEQAIDMPKQGAA